MPILSMFPGGINDENGGFTLTAVSNISTLVSSGKVYIKWSDPEDVIVSNMTLASWNGTLLVRKAGSVPTTRKDGTVVLDSKTKNAYETTYFCDSGLTDGVTYYYKFFPYTTQNTYTNSVDNEFNATPTAQVVGINDWLVTDMSASDEAGDGKMTVKWTDPAASITSDGITLATWASTTIVVKADSYANSKDDADAAYTLKVTTRNQYSSTPLMITGLTNGTKYYIAFFSETADGGINTATSQRITGTANRITISTIPSQSDQLVYNGNAQTPSWDNYDDSKMTLSVTAQTNAGTYSASFTPKDDYMWSDGTTVAKSVSWTIGTGQWAWGSETAIGDAAWWAGLKNWIAGASTSELSACVGKTKSVTLTSAVQGTTTHLVRCIGYNCDRDKSNTSRNTLTFHTKNCLTTSTVFGSSNGKWTGSTVRTLCTSYYNAFPGKASVVTVSKGTATTINGSQAATPTYQDETVFLPSDCEMGFPKGADYSNGKGYAASYDEFCEQNTSKTAYQYYTSNSSRIKYYGDSGTSAAYYWERSLHYNYAVGACYVGYDGKPNSNYCSSSYGFAPAFVI